MKVWLDDERPAPGGWVHVKDFAECLVALGQNEVSELSLDHDLGDPEPTMTGYGVVLFIESMAAVGNWEYVPDKMRVHSANPVGRAKMEAGIRSIEKMRKKFVEGVDR